MSTEQKFPTEDVELPSEGLLYPADSPLSSGKVEMKYMTAKEEDILTNQNYIEKGVVIDKLLQALIVDKSIDYNSLLVGDKNALLIAARVLGYGKDYEFSYAGEKEVVDLSLLSNKQIDRTLLKDGKNELSFKLPNSGSEITFRLLTHGDEMKIDQEVRGLKKMDKNSSAELSTKLKHMIISVDGNSDNSFIRQFVDNRFLAMDSRAFRKHIQAVQPDVDLKFYPENGPEGGVEIPIGINFLWPDARV